MFMIGGMGAAVPFLNLYMARQHLSGTQIGFTIAIGSIIGLFSAPYWVKLQSEDENPIRMLSITLLVSGVMTVIYGFQTAFIGITIFYTLRTLFSSAHMTTADMLALRALKGTQSGYGSIRFLGSLGWAVIVLFTGWLNEKTSITHGFGLHLAMNLISIFILYHLIDKKNDDRPAQRTGIFTYFAGIPGLFRNPAISVLAILTVLTGIGNNGVINYEILYLDQLGATEFFIGVASMISSLVEIPTMLLTDRIAKKTGIKKLILSALLLNVLLRGFVVLSPSVAGLIIARGIGGIAYSFLTVGFVMYVNAVLPSEKSGTALVILTITIPTLINIIMTPIYGSLFDLVGAGSLYLISLVGYAFGWIVFRRSPVTV